MTQTLIYQSTLLSILKASQSSCDLSTTESLDALLMALVMRSPSWSNFGVKIFLRKPVRSASA